MYFGGRLNGGKINWWCWKLFCRIGICGKLNGINGFGIINGNVWLLFIGSVLGGRSCWFMKGFGGFGLMFILLMLGMVVVILLWEFNIILLLFLWYVFFVIFMIVFNGSW